MEEDSNRLQEYSKSNPLFTNKGKLLIALVLIFGALAYFGFIAFKGATVYYLTVAELNEQGATKDEQIVRVSGKLVPESYRRDEVSAVAYFSLTDGTEVMPALYKGALPDLFFNEHSEIILEGTYQPGQEFYTQNVIVKCPSKYIVEDKETT